MSEAGFDRLNRKRGEEEMVREGEKVTGEGREREKFLKKNPCGVVIKRDSNTISPGGGRKKGEGKKKRIEDEGRGGGELFSEKRRNVERPSCLKEDEGKRGVRKKG